MDRVSEALVYSRRVGVVSACTSCCNSGRIIKRTRTSVQQFLRGREFPQWFFDPDHIQLM